jgi:hypothetical protein
MYCWENAIQKFQSDKEVKINKTVNKNQLKTKKYEPTKRTILCYSNIFSINSDLSKKRKREDDLTKELEEIKKKKQENQNDEDDDEKLQKIQDNLAEVEKRKKLLEELRKIDEKIHNMKN